MAGIIDTSDMSATNLSSSRINQKDAALDSNRDTIPKKIKYLQNAGDYDAIGSIGSEDNKIFSTTSVEPGGEKLRLDRDWAKHAFMIKPFESVHGDLVSTASNLKNTDFENTYYNTAWTKFEDTTLGGSRCINPRPQFTAYADIPIPGRMPGRKRCRVTNYTHELGLGGYYNEAIHENQQLVYLRMGVPQFNSLTNFFTGFYNNSAARLVKTGRSDGIIYETFRTMGKIIGIAAQVILWPVTVTIGLGRAIKWAFDMDTSKFYTFKSTMFNYWATVQLLVNQVCVNLGFVQQVVEDLNVKTNTDQEINKIFKLDGEYTAQMAKLMPGIFNERGFVDIFAVAMRAQLMYNAMHRKQIDEFNQSNYSDFFGYVRKEGQAVLEKPKGATFFTALEDFVSTSVNVVNETQKDSISLERDPRVVEKESKAQAAAGKTAAISANFRASAANYFEAAMNDGYEVACFRVEPTGSSSESFSNSFGENELQSKFNQTSSSARSARFSFADGNITDGVIGKVVGGVVDAAKGIIDGALDSLHISGLMSLAGNAFVDIPKHWVSSSASLPRMSYTIDLISPYGNSLSRLQHELIPLCMLLACAMPRSTGRQSWDSPYIMQLYDQGRAQSRLCAVSSLSVERGIMNLAYVKGGIPRGIRVSLEVVDMSSVVHMPISTGIGSMFNVADGIFDDDTVFHDYMAVLGSLGLYEQFYKWPKFLMRAARARANTYSLSSPAMWSMFAHNKTPVGWFDALYRGSAVMSGNFSTGEQ